MINRKPLAANSAAFSTTDALPRASSSIPNPNPNPQSRSDTHGPSSSTTVHEDSDNEWDQSDPDWDDDGEDDMLNSPSPVLPSSLRIGGASGHSSKAASGTDLPSTLKAGPPGGLPVRKSNENLSPTGSLPSHSMNSVVSGTSSLSISSQEPHKTQSYNPFLRPQKTGDQIFGTDQVWADEPSNYITPNVQTGPAELPANDTSKPLISLDTEPVELDTSSRWALDEAPSQPNELLQDRKSQKAADHTWGQQQEGPESKTVQNEHVNMPVSEGAVPLGILAAHGDGGSNTAAQPDVERQHATIPARSAREEPLSAHAQPNIAASLNRPVSQAPNRVGHAQRSEHYHIKQIRWHDAYSKQLRTSPILIQSANGPCPLLALVNALVLSTPMDERTALVETLRTREQVSLGLLLDAVFDELTSGRRRTTTELPDVGELYAFLLTLHTGMNVNPRFVFTSSRSSTDFHPALRDYSQPGSFEDTKEMQLYSTFNIPLMHGWLPTRDSAAYAAFDRSAKNYDEALNIQFHEEELEHKLNTDGLSVDEQHLFEDLHTIKEFLATWPTQLTDYGLKVLSQHVSPGQFAILFRNDHFSTLYKEPRSQQLLTLVTDAGYSTHEEIVWESLVDVNGAETEHFSGDFRPVSHNIPVQDQGPAGPRNSSLTQQNVQSMLDVDQGWTTVQNRRNNRNREHTDIGITRGAGSGLQPVGLDYELPPPPLPPRHEMTREEQEDADLALALQLQEEEEERQRTEQAARRREDELSNRFIEQAARGPQPVTVSTTPAQPRSGNARIANNPEIRPLIPPRRSNNTGSLSIPSSLTTTAPPASRPLTVRNNDGDEPPPPTYEQAAKGKPFHPPFDHPASPLAPIPGEPSSRTSPAAQRRQQSAYMDTSSMYPSASDPSLPGSSAQSRMGRRPSRTGPPVIDTMSASTAIPPRRRSTVSSPVGGPVEDRDKCVVM